MIGVRIVQIAFFGLMAMILHISVDTIFSMTQALQNVN